MFRFVVPSPVTHEGDDGVLSGPANTDQLIEIQTAGVVDVVVVGGLVGAVVEDGEVDAGVVVHDALLGALSALVITRSSLPT